MTQPPAHDRDDLTQESIDSLRKLAIAAMESNRRFYDRQIEALQAATNQTARLFRSRLEDAGALSDALEQWSALAQAQAQRFTEISSATAKTIAEMGERLRQTFAVSDDLFEKAGHKQAEAPEVPVERRLSTVVINFPERRGAPKVKNPGRNQHFAAMRKTS